jgi:hypothetical protein
MRGYCTQKEIIATFNPIKNEDCSARTYGQIANSALDKAR